jgi:hypothetical protein
MEVNGKVINIGPDGKANVIYDGGTNFDKLPEFAAKSAGFTARMVEAERNMRDILKAQSVVDPKTGQPSEKKFDPTTLETGMLRTIKNAVGGNFVRSPDMQRYEQAAEQWIRAFLRKESGAAIGKDEFARDFVVYFPQPGDSPEVVKQKERARLEAKRSFQGETRGFFAHTSPKHAGMLKEWGDASDAEDQQAKQPAAQQKPVAVRSIEDVAKLKPKTPFIIPDGPNKGQIGYAQ